MEWMGFLALMLLLYYSSYPNKVKKLEAKVKKLERKEKGDNTMSKLVQELVNKNCKMKTGDALQLVGSDKLQCFVLDADDEWIKVRYEDKKKNQVTKLLRIENIDDIEIMEV